MLTLMPMQRNAHTLRLFLCGDVMTGRGIDQLLPHPSAPELHEPYVRDARDYVKLAEERVGRLPRAVPWHYVWGDTLDELERRRPHARIVNLETSITTHSRWEPKGINYRMHPANVPVLAAAKIDCCVLANNHVLDYGRPGLLETLTTLEKAGLRHTGAGRHLDEAEAPAILPLPGGGRLLVFAFGTWSSGIGHDWAAESQLPGVAYLPDLSLRSADHVADVVRKHRRPGDRAIVSLHTGGNWGWKPDVGQPAFSHRLIEVADVDVIHGHSSHHPKGIEVYQGKLVLYGCGDFLDDYEGILGHEAFRSELGAMYFPDLDRDTGRLVAMDVVPTRQRRLQVNRASERDAPWIADVLEREGHAFGTGVERMPNGVLRLRWGER